jgi:hypothetical protein
MWPDDIHWLPLAIEGKTFDASFDFLPGDVIARQDIQIR